jgi:CrcB protein
VTWLLVACGAAAGSTARYLTDRAVRSRWPGRFPWGTLLVNVGGSLSLGLVAGIGGYWSALLAIGFCGAFTTWSTLAVDVVTLAREGDWVPAALDLLVSVTAGVAAFSLGLWLAPP